MKKLTNIIIHCSDSEFGNVNQIRNWHKQNGWNDIGYHYVILNGKISPKYQLNSLDGCIECGRYLDGDDFITDNETGAHTLGYNSNSIGICLIGTTTFSTKQLTTAYQLVSELCKMHKIPFSKVLGHCETESGRKSGKTCPNLDMKTFRKGLV